MATGQELVPVGEAAAVPYDDTSMNGSNGPPSPIVVEPGDREGPTAEEPERAFYMYAPNFIGRWWEGRTSQLVLQ